MKYHKLAIFTGALAVSLVIGAPLALAQDDEFENSSEDQLLVPDDLTIVKNDQYELEEQRVGGRLERITVRRNNGLTEVYQNQRNDTIWSAEEDELGDLENVRQWKIGSW